jgi:hypothetical protein
MRYGYGTGIRRAMLQGASVARPAGFEVAPVPTPSHAMPVAPPRATFHPAAAAPEVAQAMAELAHLQPPHGPGSLKGFGPQTRDCKYCWTDCHVYNHMTGDYDLIPDEHGSGLSPSECMDQSAGACGGLNMVKGKTYCSWP